MFTNLLTTNRLGIYQNIRTGYYHVQNARTGEIEPGYHASFESAVAAQYELDNNPAESKLADPIAALEAELEAFDELLRTHPLFNDLPPLVAIRDPEFKPCPCCTGAYPIYTSADCRLCSPQYQNHKESVPA